MAKHWTKKQIKQKRSIMKKQSKQKRSNKRSRKPDRRSTVKASQNSGRYNFLNSDDRQRDFSSESDPFQGIPQEIYDSYRFITDCAMGDSESMPPTSFYELITHGITSCHDFKQKWPREYELLSVDQLLRVLETKRDFVSQDGSFQKSPPSLLALTLAVNQFVSTGDLIGEAVAFESEDKLEYGLFVGYRPSNRTDARDFSLLEIRIEHSLKGVVALEYEGHDAGMKMYTLRVPKDKMDFVISELNKVGTPFGSNYLLVQQYLNQYRKAG